MVGGAVGGGGGGQEEIHRNGTKEKNIKEKRVNKPGNSLAP